MTSQAVKLTRLSDHIKEMSSNNKFAEEFSKLDSVGTDQPCEAAKANGAKNRKADILPYDRSRVVLIGLDEKSDYINANFVPGEDEDKEFIATQVKQGSSYYSICKKARVKI